MKDTKRMTMLALFCALAYIAVFISRFLPPMFSAFPFLKYDPKDVIIVIGGFLFGPFSAFLISLVVSLVEMLTISGTHIIGCIMNIASTCAFSCVAAAVYTRFRSLKGAGAGLTLGTVCTAATMLVLNYLLTPLYMQGVSREVITSLLIPAILPFNIIKCVLNAGFALMLYKPVVKALRRSGFLERGTAQNSGSANIPVLIASLFLIAMSVIAIIILN